MKLIDVPTRMPSIVSALTQKRAKGMAGNKDMKKDQSLLTSTLGDLVEALKEGLGLMTDAPAEDTTPKRYVYGYAGLKDLLGCGDTAVWRLLKSGAIDAAVAKHGKLIVADADMVLQLLRLNKQHTRRGGARGGYNS